MPAKKTLRSKPIICGTDFSENAMRAADAAAALAHRADKPLVLVHVADQFNAQAENQKNTARFLRPARKQLEVEAARLRQSGATVEEVLLSGRVAEEAIVDLARERQPALVLVSSVSKTTFDRWTLGSVSERVAENSSAPTLVLRQSGVFEAWAQGTRPLNVFVAADFSPGADAAIQWVKQLRRLGPCEVTVAHVNWPPEERARLGVTEPARIAENPREIQRVLERDLADKVQSLLGKNNTRIVVEPALGRPDARLIGLASEAQADLIVVGTPQHRGLGSLWHPSIARGVLRHAPISVACIPTGAADEAMGPRIRGCRRVVAAVDAKDERALSVGHAYSIVSPGGTVRLVHVIKGARKGLLPTRSGDSSAPDAHRAAAKLQRQLLALVPIDARTRRIKTEVEVVEEPDIAKAICQAGERFNADVICIGGNTRPGWVAKVLGSNTLGVLSNSRRPVLVVWPPKE